MKCRIWGLLLMVAGILSCDQKESPPPPPADGRELAYRSHCGACHQWDGAGVPGMYPALAEVDWVREADARRLIRVVLHGMVGPLHLNGKLFQTTAPLMPGQGEMLTDERVGEIVTFVLRRFAGRDEVVTASDVGRVREMDRERKVPWTERELINPE